MSASEPYRPRVERILVALDGSEHSLAALVGATDLAARLHAEVHGLFVEDAELLRLSSLPFARELRLPTGTLRALSSGTLEAELGALASRARRALLTLSDRLHVQASFRVQRGHVAREVLAAARESDLLLLGWASRPLSQRVRLGSVARAALEQATGPVLLCRRGQGGLRSVVMVYETPLGAPGAAQAPAHAQAAPGAAPAPPWATMQSMDRALALAALLVEAGLDSLTVLAQGRSIEEARALERRLSAKLTRQGLPARVRPLVARESPSGSGGAAVGLCHAIQSEPEGLVVLSAESQLLTAGTVAGTETSTSLLEELGCPVLVVR